MANVQLAVAGDETTQVILSVPGVQGPAGSNLPPSGTTHQLLYKQSNTNYDTAWKLLTNDNVDAAAAIAGTKISPNFGSQNVLTTGTSTAASFIPSSSSVPTNGLYLPAANNVALSTNGTGRLFVDASGLITHNFAGTVGTAVDAFRIIGAPSYLGANSEARLVLSPHSSSRSVYIGCLNTSSTNMDMVLGTSASNTPVERLRITSAGLVGIGTSSPNYKLEVAPDANRSFAVDTDGTFSLVLRNTSTNAGADLAFDTKDSLQFKSNGNPKVTILNSGNVGIGTTSPIRLFHALDSANSIVGRVESGQSSSWLQFAASGTGTASRIGDPGGSTNAGLAFMIADTERARIDSSGRLLVGTITALTNIYTGATATTPQIQLSGAGLPDSSLSLLRTGTTGATVFLNAGSSSNNVINGSITGRLAFNGYDGTNYRTNAQITAEVDASPAYASTALMTGQTYRIVTVTSSDWSSIGGPNPASVGNVFTATGPSVTSLGTAILNAGNMPGRLVFSTTADGSVSPTERLRITSAGLVGVGTSSPVVDLDVAPAASTATFRIHARSNTTPVAAIELVRGTNTTFGADGNGDYRIKNDAGNLSFEYGDSGVTNERLRITSAGLVGIGTISPGSILTVQASGTQQSLFSARANAGAGGGMVLQTDASGDGLFRLYDSAGAIQVQLDTDGGDNYIALGRVGIGTTSPQSALSFASGSHIGVATTDAADNGVLTIGGAGAALNTRGGYIELYGNENAALGNVEIAAGKGGASTATAGSIILRTGPGTADERARIDSSGRLLVGTPNAETASLGALFQIQATSGSASAFIKRNDNGALPSYLYLGKSRGTTVNSTTIVQSGDSLGAIRFTGADGSTEAGSIAAQITAAVDASPAYASTALVSSQTYRIVTVTSSDWSSIGGPNPASVGNVFTATGPSVTSLGTAILNAGNMPGRLVFSTTADGSVSPTERMRINSAGLVGIGTSSPIVDLDVAPAASTATFRIHARSNTTPVAAIELVRGTNTTFGADGNGDYRIKNDTGNLSFEYGDSGTTTERARIDSSGRLLVGTPSARALEPFGITTNGTITSHVFEGVQTGSGLVGIACVNNSDTTAVNGAYLLLGRTRGNAVSSNTPVQAGDNLGTIGFAGADGTDLRTKAAAIYAEVDGTPGANDMPGRLVFSTTADGASSPTERMRITSTGQLRLAGAGITFNGDTATANELDDYEEGTWTPDYQTSNSDISITSTTVSHAVYTKIGNRVFCTCRFFSNVASVGTGTVRVTGLPFTSASSQGDVSCVISFAARFSTAAPVTATVRSSATQLDLLTVYTDATLGGAVTYMPAANLRAATANSNIISISFNYIV